MVWLETEVHVQKWFDVKLGVHVQEWFGSLLGVYMPRWNKQ